jgi:hypothetical protein
MSPAARKLGGARQRGIFVGVSWRYILALMPVKKWLWKVVVGGIALLGATAGYVLTGLEIARLGLPIWAWQAILALVFGVMLLWIAVDVIGVVGKVTKPTGMKVLGNTAMGGMAEVEIDRPEKVTIRNIQQINGSIGRAP